MFSKIKNPIIGELFVFLVAPAGIEPATQGFSVLCSTDWAMKPNGGSNGIWTRDLLRDRQAW